MDLSPSDLGSSIMQGRPDCCPFGSSEGGPRGIIRDGFVGLVILNSTLHVWRITGMRSGGWKPRRLGCDGRSRTDSRDRRHGDGIGTLNTGLAPSTNNYRGLRGARASLEGGKAAVSTCTGPALKWVVSECSCDSTFGSTDPCFRFLSHSTASAGVYACDTSSPCVFVVLPVSHEPSASSHIDPSGSPSESGSGYASSQL